MATDDRRRARRGDWGANLLLLATLLLFAVAVGLYLRDRDEEELSPTPPASLPGQNEFRHVYLALRAEGLDVAPARRGIPIGVLSVPGQGFTVNEVPLFVFFYDGATAREAESPDADPAAVLAAQGGTATPSADAALIAHSNMIAVLAGGSDDLRAKVERAITGLP